ncbi:MAG: winged helix-turn-helix transcriptional regulator [Nitrososphaerales archaeon]
MSKLIELNQQVIDSCKIIHAEWNEMTRVWTLPVIHALGLQQPARFNELKRRIEGISATSLSERLNELEHRSVIQRKVFPETPPRVEYSLTPKGKDLLQILDQFAEWVKKWNK